MPTLKNRFCYLLPAVLSAAAALGGNVHAQDADLILEVLVNRVPAQQLASFSFNGGALAADASTLRQLGLKWPGSQMANGPIPLASLTGLVIDYDTATQRLHLTAPVALLDRPPAYLSADQTDNPQVDPASLAPGVVLNYDLYGTGDASQVNINALTELRLSGVGPGVWRNLMSSRASHGTSSNTGNSTSDEARNTRLDTSWQYNLPDKMVAFTVGDTVTGAPSWSRSARIGGLRLGRVFALQPYRSFLPVSSFQGSAVLPSTVDLFINGMRQSTQQVQPGEFQLSTIPRINGVGQASMVITDVAGQRRLVSFDLYGTPQLLQAGLTDWSVEFGAVRRDYGLRSFSYNSRPVVNAMARHGSSDAMTLEAHAQAGSDIRMAGTGGVWLVGKQGGVVNASLAASNRSANAIASAMSSASAATPSATGSAAAILPASGTQRTAGYQFSAHVWSLSLSSRRASAGFADVASVSGTGLPRKTDSVYVSVTGDSRVWDLWRTGANPVTDDKHRRDGGEGANTKEIKGRNWGQFGLGLVRQQQATGESSSYASVSWSRQLTGGSTFNINLNRTTGTGSGTSFYVGLSVPIDQRLTVSSSINTNGPARNLTVQASQRPKDDDGGWGWRAQAVAANSNSSTAQAEVNYLGQYARWAAGLSQSQSKTASTAMFANASGAAVWTGNRLYAARRVDDAYALVSTNGMADIPIRLQNRLVGKTDEQGLLLVAPLYSYQRNRLEIDTLALPIDMRIAQDKVDAVPAGQSGMRVKFSLERVLAVQLALKDAKGVWIPAGSDVRIVAPGALTQAATAPPTSPANADDPTERLNFSSTAMVGYDGMVYLENPPAGGIVHALGSAGPCQAALQFAAAARGSLDLGEVVCK